MDCAAGDLPHPAAIPLCGLSFAASVAAADCSHHSGDHAFHKHLYHRIASVVPGIQSNPHGQPPVALFLVFPLVWFCIFTMSIGVLVIAIIYAIKAGRGEWADYPVLGRLARKMLKMAPTPGQPG